MPLSSLELWGSGQCLPLCSQLQIGLDPRPMQGACFFLPGPGRAPLSDDRDKCSSMWMCVGWLGGCVGDGGYLPPPHLSVSLKLSSFVHSFSKNGLSPYYVLGLMTKDGADESEMGPPWRSFIHLAHTLSTPQPFSFVNQIGKNLSNHLAQPLPCCKDVNSTLGRACGLARVTWWSPVELECKPCLLPPARSIGIRMWDQHTMLFI